MRGHLTIRASISVTPSRKYESVIHKNICEALKLRPGQNSPSSRRMVRSSSYRFRNARTGLVYKYRKSTFKSAQTRHIGSKRGVQFTGPARR